MRSAMTLWYAAFLGFIQGLTEYIPVSSTAHLRIAPALFGRSDDGAAYTAVIQLGTLAAVIVYFAKDLVAMPGAMMRDWQSPEGRLPWLIAIATVPIGIAGLMLKKQVESDSWRSLYVIAATLIGIGIVMAVIDHRTSVRGTGRGIDSVSVRDAVLVGLAQTLALVPGVSRSGATICMLLVLGFARSDAARFSFLMSIPAVGGAGVFEVRKAIADLGADAIPPLVVGTVVAGITGYITISWLMRWLGSHELVGFAIYRIAAGIALLGALAAGVLKSGIG